VGDAGDVELYELKP